MSGRARHGQMAFVRNQRESRILDVHVEPWRVLGESNPLESDEMASQGLNSQFYSVRVEP
eukprot:1194491-Prorocentrum_minimum.AAC.2